VLGRRRRHHGGRQPRRRRGGRSHGWGLNISLPEEQHTNPYVTPELSFEFRYFFMRKLWFAHMARAIAVFPGGFGTLDEMSEILTLAQTHKLDRRITVLLYGESYWKEIINFDALIRYGMINRDDLDLFRFADDPQTALALLTEGMVPLSCKRPRSRARAPPRTKPPGSIKGVAIDRDPMYRGSPSGYRLQARGANVAGNHTA
jgi:uncharacterized protein (TIGR00730 family)